MREFSKSALDRYITGNYGEDQFRGLHHCFACGRECGDEYLADTRDAQTVYVGSDCYGRIVAAGNEGYQPPKGGPRLWTMAEDDDA